METVKAAALGLVFVSAACCVYYYLLPNGSLSRTAKRILAVFFLACVLSPLFSVFGAVRSFSLFSAPGETQPVSADPGPLLAAAEASARQAAESVIRAYTDEPYEIQITVHITDAGDIDIERLRVRFDRAFAGLDALTAALRKALGPAAETEVGNAVEERSGASGAAAEG